MAEMENKFKNFIDEKYINSLITDKEISDEELQALCDKAKLHKGLTVEDVAKLLTVSSKDKLKYLMDSAQEVKDYMYGNRVVLFAPLYISNHCVNNCTYCGYRRDNVFDRQKLNKEQIIKELVQLNNVGHKRIALECGEDPANTDIDYVCDAIKTIYENSDIRRINVNVAATTTEEYKKLHACDIGTYLLFQETYYKPTYEEVHPKSLKGDYFRQLFALHHAMEAGIDDVGGGVLFGFSDYRYEVISLMLHNLDLEKQFNVGFHTVSVPRLMEAKGVDKSTFNHLIDDEIFTKIVCILRMAMPKVGIILSTRETKEMREKLINCGVSQISAGSKTDVGGYTKDDAKFEKQFDLSDERSPKEIIKWLLELGKVPSYCTACYRNGRTGEKFMEMVGAGSIKEYCISNSILTLKEFVIAENDPELIAIADGVINRELENLESDKLRKIIEDKLQVLEDGGKDQYV